jgi:hypothetical protein
MNQQPFEGKAPGDARRDLAGYQGCFEWDGAASAHGIEQDFFGGPAGEPKNSCCQIFPQRCFDGDHPMATFEKGFAGGIEIERDGTLVKIASTLMFGRSVLTLGLLWRDATNLSQTASLIRRVRKSRLGRGQRRALTLTLIVCEGANHSGQASA